MEGPFRSSPTALSVVFSLDLVDILVGRHEDGVVLVAEGVADDDHHLCIPGPSCREGTCCEFRIWRSWGLRKSSITTG